MQKDKILHFLAGLSIALFVGLVLWNPWIGLMAGIVAGIAKELIWDLWLKKGTPEFMDFLATFLGGAAAFAILLLAKL